VAWSPSDTKFATASVDHSVRVWDVYMCVQHAQLAGHSSDCTSVDWHPTLSLLASGGRDSEVGRLIIPTTLVSVYSAHASVLVASVHFWAP
jgi:polyadenylation factor subunit 2